MNDEEQNKVNLLLQTITEIELLDSEIEALQGILNQKNKLLSDLENREWNLRDDLTTEENDEFFEKLEKQKEGK